ncbi:GNAT family N-acetyltransferase [Tenacibaculum sp. M341]|uniref:GNAT family N-acetyltransferase n=1 Tax=Tenacibaculum sp. M341 TaxID=2530339 RepID=UPI0010462770|nr:GNAT family N-acetyltransferase [Tenacibaculum sp. M341]TCI90378.1 N-acetyltransferase [Tenacibaculum sp. M341]
MISTTKTVFSRNIEGLGEISIRPIHLASDIETLYSWVTKPYAKYWGMLDQTKEEVKAAYQEIEEDPNHHTYIGELNGNPIFLMERYKASEDVIAEHYEALDDDYGMHILVAPAEKRIPQFTWHVFSTVMHYFFSLDFVNRVVVEPDKNNEKIHVLNKKAGFVYQKEIELPHKTASLAFCTREEFLQ